jgi:sigma-B regulation protein RsbU (phosphoserine phosphatase)
LGYKKESVFEDATLPMTTGDNVLMTTDGVIECRDENGDQFGVGKLIRTIQKESFINSPLETLKQDITHFNQEKFDDDVSVIAISAM